ncbi:MBL fold metallo-hydrolase [Paraglaciecola aquimarina]|uniref:MBL fold metallo-hydrolase n=1 Tax=Paraglaciecola algarum TaxID=3050085 RepID=A0ABS9DE14_9ALTE|nr:MBL fold metallo-hydrolase [Paraglaciecola sp. G1-23]MCF2950004.1 MBL fold metallo-hydrolase [Paraglaciecola sp. G1-23]
MAVSVNAFFHQGTGTASYVVVDSSQTYAVVIDSVLDLDMGSGRVSSTIADQQLAFIQKHKLELVWILETHAHADHLTAAHYLKQQTQAPVAIGEGILQVQRHFSSLFSKHPALADEASGFDHLVKDQEVLTFGDSEIQVLSTPGHTDDSVSYLIDNNLFVGDTLFMPDGGTARCDFPGGDAAKLWASIEKIHKLTDDTIIWVCHDYQPDGREVQIQTTVAQSKAHNIHINQDTKKQDYISMRNKRDAGLAAPKLLYPSLQVNLWGGLLPEPKTNGKRYICTPITENYGEKS